MIKELHSLLLKQPWDKICHIDLQYLEKALLCLLLTVCAGIPPQQTQEIVNNLNNTTIPAYTSPEQLQVLIDVMFTALGCLCK